MIARRNRPWPLAAAPQGDAHPVPDHRPPRIGAIPAPASSPLGSSGQGLPVAAPPRIVPAERSFARTGGEAGPEATVAWSGAADLAFDQADDLGTARMFALAALSGLAFWVGLGALLL